VESSEICWTNLAVHGLLRIKIRKKNMNVGDDVVVHRCPNSGTAVQTLSLTEDGLSQKMF
jgi:hypothetical protein